MKQNLLTTISLLVLIFVVLAACGSEAGDEAEPTPAPAQAGSGASSSGGDTEESSADTSSTVNATTKVNLNLRQGPGTNYGRVGSLPADTGVTVVGRNSDSSWLLVQTESGEAWMSGQADFVSVDSAALAGLPVVDAPPPAYDASNPMVQRVLNEIPLVVLHGGNHTCASHGGVNNLLPEVADGNVIGPHSGDFVLNGDNVLFEYSGGSLRLMKESAVARFENGEKFLPFEQAMQLFASGDIVWTGTLGDWPARGVTGCDPAAG